ncbi:hypothetical protein NDU88_005725 [Pleurodeles waltl]|uniref:Secreted protein n=1 Tax=Pleurodeles waltl TaxID=8319 RepID=A0AAV7UKX8_PLEWA|nr:hypothetical protein NDU88_005725 [Pleurodeles waltl]
MLFLRSPGGPGVCCACVAISGSSAFFKAKRYAGSVSPTLGVVTLGPGCLGPGPPRSCYVSRGGRGAYCATTLGPRIAEVRSQVLLSMSSRRRCICRSPPIVAPSLTSLPAPGRPNHRRILDAW